MLRRTVGVGSHSYRITNEVGCSCVCEFFFSKGGRMFSLNCLSSQEKFMFEGEG